MNIHLGTCSWTDPTLLKSGFYPKSVNSPEERLRYYSYHFDTVEVDSTYYSIPSERVARLWSERTPEDFLPHKGILSTYRASCRYKDNTFKYKRYASERIPQG